MKDVLWFILWLIGVAITIGLIIVLGVSFARFAEFLGVPERGADIIGIFGGLSTFIAAFLFWMNPPASFKP